MTKYVHVGTTPNEIKKKINEIERELNECRLSVESRDALHDELDYLYSFIQEV